VEQSINFRLLEPKVMKNLGKREFDYGNLPFKEFFPPWIANMVEISQTFQESVRALPMVMPQ
jgi:hypothetical protein